jgi:hypothetical protein
MYTTVKLSLNICYSLLKKIKTNQPKRKINFCISSIEGSLLFIKT